MTDADKRADKVVKNAMIEKAMILGIVSAKNMELEKPYDIAISIKVALKDANFKIVRK